MALLRRSAGSSREIVHQYDASTGHAFERAAASAAMTPALVESRRLIVVRDLTRGWRFRRWCYSATGTSSRSRRAAPARAGVAVVSTHPGANSSFVTRDGGQTRCAEWTVEPQQ